MLRLSVFLFAVLLSAGSAHAVPMFPNLMVVEQEGAGSVTVDSDMALCNSTGGVTFGCNGAGQTLTPGGFDF